MRIVLLAAALVLIGLSTVLFIVGERRHPGNSSRVPSRYIVSGRVTGSMQGTPWVGTVAMLGVEKVFLAADGAFRFVIPPGEYSFVICCSPRFESIRRAVVVSDHDIHLELVARPLIEISGRVVIVDSARPPHGFLVAARLPGTNVVDKAYTAPDGTFAFHLMEGQWRIDIDNLPAGYTRGVVTFGEARLPNDILTLGPEVDSSAELRIPLH